MNHTYNELRAAVAKVDPDLLQPSRDGALLVYLRWVATSFGMEAPNACEPIHLAIDRLYTAVSARQGL